MRTELRSTGPIPANSQCRAHAALSVLKMFRQWPGGTRYTSVLNSGSSSVGELMKMGLSERLYAQTPSPSWLSVTPGNQNYALDWHVHCAVFFLSFFLPSFFSLSKVHVCTYNTIFWKLVLPPSVGQKQNLLSQPLKCYVISTTLLHSFIGGTQES